MGREDGEDGEDGWVRKEAAARQDVRDWQMADCFVTTVVRPRPNGANKEILSSLT